ncbi:MAG TPA: class I SAM-dependent methyltransferase [Solirubrobacterales bacterium]|nr:class I SAM-dependent methyltransferase [Solirubrobacterales bacterium]
MHRLFAPVIAPLIEVLEPRTIVEIGSADGRLTRRVLEAVSSRDAVLHAVDPALRLDPDFVAKAGEQLVLHPERAVAALAEIGAVDLALLDGDPNYHAVHSSLTMLLRAAERDERSAPLIAVHNVQWPFGRRDGYYDPSTIPPGQLHGHSDLGLVPGRRDPQPDGLRLTPFCAVRDFLPRSGVLTAIDDLVAQSDLEWTFLEVPGFQGLGVLAEARLIAERHGIAPVLADLGSSRFLGEQARRTESARVETTVELTAIKRQLAAVDPEAPNLAPEDEGAQPTPAPVGEPAAGAESATLVTQVAEYRAQKEALEWRLSRLDEDLASRSVRLDQLESERAGERRALVEAQVRLEHTAEELRTEGDSVVQLGERVSELRSQLEDSERQLTELGERERLAQGRLAHSEDALDAVKEDRNRLRARIDGMQVELRAAGARIDEIADHLARASSTRRARLARRIGAIARATTFRRHSSPGHLESARAAAERALPSSGSAAEDPPALESGSGLFETDLEQSG